MTAMVKTFGAVLIIGATSLWGIRAADRINDQYVQMQYLKKLIYQLRSEIRSVSYTHLTLPTIA